MSCLAENCHYKQVDKKFRMRRGALIISHLLLLLRSFVFLVVHKLLLSEEKPCNSPVQENFYFKSAKWTKEDRNVGLRTFHRYKQREQVTCSWSYMKHEKAEK